MPTVTFTSSGSWTALGTPVDCRAWGEGDNGTSGLHNSHAGNGGGAGAYAEETALALTVNSNYSFTIGSGGTGTATSFPGNSVTVTANNGSGTAGGAAGSNSIAFAGGGGGNGSTGTGNRGGGAGGGSAGASGAGGRGGNGTTTVGGTGGTAGTGSPGGAAGGNGGSPSTSGGAGSAPGGGGGGGGSTSTINGALGFAAGGQITIIYTNAVAGTATLAGAGTLTAAGITFNPAAPVGQPFQAPGPLRARRFGYARHQVQPGKQIVTVAGTATLAGVGTMVPVGGLPNPVVVNQWSNSYGQGTTFTTVTSALQSCVTGLNASFSVGPGTGVPSPGNWLFAIASWTQDPQITNVHVGTGDDGHSWWREFPASSSAGNTRTAIAYTPNITSQVQNVYVAPDGEIAAINVLVVEISGLGPWDTVAATNTGYTAAGTSVSLSASAPAQGSFFIGATGGDNISSGQAFAPSGWQPLATQTQTDGTDHLADNILTAAFLPSTISSVSVTGTSSSAENLSGFLLGVYVSGVNPVPATQNPDWPYIVFEAGFGAGFNTPDSEITWTAITSRLWDWDETTGIQFELGQIQATNLTMHLDNLDGYLSPSNSASPYFPNVQPGTPLRLRAALGTMAGQAVNRWYVIQRNATQWGEEIDEVFRRWCPVSGTDMWAALSGVPPTSYRAEVYEDGPYAWWPADDQPGLSGVQPAQLLNAAIGNTNVLNILLSPNGGSNQTYYSESGASAAGIIPSGLPAYTAGANGGWMFGDPQSSIASLEAGTGNSVTATPGSASWMTTGQGGSTGSFGWYLSCNDSSFPPLNGGVTVEAWFNYQYYGSANSIVTGEQFTPGFNATLNPVVQQPYNSPFTILELATSSAPVAVLQLDVHGHLSLITYNGGTGTSHSVYTASDLRSNSWHAVTVTLTTTTWAVWLDGGASAQVSGTAAGMTSAWNWLIVNGDLGSSGGSNPSALVHGGNGSFSHIAVYPYILPFYRILDHYWAAATAFGQLPAPTAVQAQFYEEPEFAGVSELSNEQEFSPYQGYAPDGTAGYSSSPGPAYSNNNGVSASAVVAATAPGGIISGPSAWVTATNGGFYAVNAETLSANNFGLWVTWTGVAPSFNVYTASDVTTDHEAAVVNGTGTSFASGFGATAVATGVSVTASGNGSVPPVTGSAIGDTVGQRIERLLSNGRFTSPNRCIDPAPLLVQANSSGGGQQIGAGVQAIQQSDSGMLYVDNNNHLTYWGRPHLASQYSSPVWQIGPTSPRIPYYREIEWVTDPQRVWNAITIQPVAPAGASLPLITPSDGTDVLASQVRYGAQPLQISSWLQSQAEMQNQANFLFTNYGTPRRHAENVKIDAAAYPAAWQLVLGINVGDVVTCEDWVIGGGGTVYTFRVTEIQRHLFFGFGDNPATTGSVVLTLDYEPVSYWS